MIWLYHSEPRVFDKMGRAGSTDAQHGADCTGASGEFSQRNRLGGVYRCSDHGSQRTGPSGRIHLMGSAGTAEKRMLNNSKHLILEAPHPSPLSAYRGFFGSRLFSQTNHFLEEHGVTPIDWQIE